MGWIQCISDVTSLHRIEDLVGFTYAGKLLNLSVRKATAQ